MKKFKRRKTNDMIVEDHRTMCLKLSWGKSKSSAFRLKMTRRENVVSNDIHYAFSKCIVITRQMINSILKNVHVYLSLNFQRQSMEMLLFSCYKIYCVNSSHTLFNPQMHESSSNLNGRNGVNFFIQKGTI